jgi:hypothetical protein
MILPQKKLLQGNTDNDKISYVYLIKPAHHET